MTTPAVGIYDKCPSCCAWKMGLASEHKEACILESFKVVKFNNWHLSQSEQIGSPCNQIAEVYQPGNPAALFSGHQHEAISK